MEPETRAGRFLIPKVCCPNQGGVAAWASRRIASLCFLVLLIMTGQTGAEECAHPFVPGEELTYRLSWGIFNVGSAVLRIHDPVVLNGREACHFSFTIRTNRFADTVYKIRNRIDGYTDPAISHSVHYTKKQREGRRERDEVVTFDWEQQTVQYSNYGEKRDPIEIVEGTYDPLSLLFAVRLLPLAVGREITVPVTDGKKLVQTGIIVLKKESLKVPAGRFDAWRLQPELKDLGGVFKKSKKARLEIWFSDDEFRIPLKVKSRVIVGSFRAALVSINRPPAKKVD